MSQIKKMMQAVTKIRTGTDNSQIFSVFSTTSKDYWLQALTLACMMLCLYWQIHKETKMYNCKQL